jgi:hypothetical protein
MATPSISKFKISRVPSTKECLHICELLGIDVQQDDEEQIQEIDRQVTDFVFDLAKADNRPKQAFDSLSPKKKSEVLKNIYTYLKENKVIL